MRNIFLVYMLSQAAYSSRSACVHNVRSNKPLQKYKGNTPPQSSLCSSIAKKQDKRIEPLKYCRPDVESYLLGVGVS